MNEAPGETEILMELAGWKTKEMLKVYGRYQTETLVKSAKKNCPEPKGKNKVVQMGKAGGNDKN